MAEGIASGPPFVIRLPYTALLNMSPNLDVLTIGLSLFPMSEILFVPTLGRGF